MKTSTPRVIMEQIAELAKLIQQNHVENQNDIRQLSNKLNSMETTIVSMDTKVGVVDTKLSSMDAQIGSIESKLDPISVQLARIEEKNTAVEAKLTGLTDRFVVQDGRVWFLAFTIITVVVGVGGVLVRVLAFPS